MKYFLRTKNLDLLSFNFFFFLINDKTAIFFCILNVTILINFLFYMWYICGIEIYQCKSRRNLFISVLFIFRVCYIIYTYILSNILIYVFDIFGHFFKKIIMGIENIFNYLIRGFLNRFSEYLNPFFHSYFYHFDKFNVKTIKLPSKIQ